MKPKHTTNMMEHVVKMQKELTKEQVALIIRCTKRRTIQIWTWIGADPNVTNKSIAPVLNTGILVVKCGKVL